VLAAEPLQHERHSSLLEIDLRLDHADAPEPCGDRRRALELVEDVADWCDPSSIPPACLGSSLEELDHSSRRGSSFPFTEKAKGGLPCATSWFEIPDRSQKKREDRHPWVITPGTRIEGRFTIERCCSTARSTARLPPPPPRVTLPPPARRAASRGQAGRHPGRAESALETIRPTDGIATAAVGDHRLATARRVRRPPPPPPPFHGRNRPRSAGLLASSAS